MRAARNMRLPHMSARQAGSSFDCSMVKSLLGTKGLIRIK